MLAGRAGGVERVAPTPAEPRTILSFRLERFTEEGDYEVLAQIELRGLFITGSLRDGDRVRLLEAKDQDGTIVARKLRNETTGALVTARGLPPFTKWLVMVAAAVIAVLTVVAVYFIVVGFSHVDRVP